jgi:hypothetical protein
LDILNQLIGYKSYNFMDVPKSAHCCCLLGYEVIVDKHQSYPALGEEDN